ncbi:alpha/beta fold hydrolase [Deinococcus sp. JMULE3]|uniref:alpha/beta fold hydrolase n=1 Tax=Deinococcus sp. JMULE3 TaxID=2518341 RepID=UPI0015751BCA|nr:alpha/beta fold hydrolase [Deinococcus sp. JMULE3]NTY02574.1 alpha/beta fold hydrolase [Deinococcus sp. JMULE3]
MTTRPARAATGAAALLALTTSLVACKPPQTPEADALKPFTGQTLTWAACDPTILGSDQSRLFTQISARLSCADLSVPLDWNRPAAGKASVSLIRFAAADSAKRQGAIFFNPGGPGGDGLAFAPIYGYLWSRGGVKTPAAANLKTMTEQFDLIGFSPRGVGASSRLNCGTNELSDPIRPPATDRSEKNVQAMLREGKLVALACQKNPLTPFINTDATARDLNLARQLMGDQKLNYIGYSYGTWLGSWYAKLFPQHTGRMLLDGNTSFNAPFEETFGYQPMAFERDFRDSVAPYLARQHAYFGLGQSGAAVYAAQNGLDADLRAITSRYIAQFMYGRDDLPLIGVILRAAVTVSALIQANPQAGPDELSALAAQQTYLPDEAGNEEALGVALNLIQVREDLRGAAPAPVELDASSSVFTAVTCNDTPWSADLKAVRARDEQEARAYPLLGGASVANACYQWKGGPSVAQPAIPANMPPLLMLQNELDPATAQEGALNALNSTPGAKMIFIDDEPQHAAFPYGTACVDTPITEYFLTGNLPTAKKSDCAALPLPGEASTVPVPTAPGKTLKVQRGALCVAQPDLSALALREQDLQAASLGARQILTDNTRAFLTRSADPAQARLNVRDCR